ncbi:helix-turn-helix domain-containing protein [Brevundimonas sp. 2R-24]|uniref:Helix-turn-helix domain-containing protein n=1 Tax=Peiella sedimenti TaxID=3061083 RepID=A0ABT8SLS3_9CAUL|nr:helix-turn-helix domain-containing protein [Caulobacteraceae bacterium XZ-24]
MTAAPQLTLVHDDPLVALGEVKTVSAGSEIFLQDQAASCLYRLVSGSVRTIRLTEDGRRQIGDFFFAGDLIGLEDDGAHAFTAEALERCEILVLRRSQVEAAATTNAAVAQILFHAGAARLQRMQRHLIQIGRKSAIERVAAALAQFAERGDAETVELPMSRQDLADYLGLTIETVSRMISQLQAHKVIRLNTLRQLRICDPMALRQLAA